MTSVVGHGVGTDSEQQFLPFYTAYSSDETHQHSAYFTVRREPRLMSLTEKRRGPRSSYIGSEVFLSLVDPKQAPYSGDLRQLSIQTLCTNRDLSLQMPKASDMSDLSLDVAAPVEEHPRGQRSESSVRTAGGRGRVVARDQPPVAQLSVARPVESGGGGRGAARSARAVRAPAPMHTARRQIEGIRSVRVERVVRRLRAPGPLAFGRGLEITLEVDELAFEGASAFMLGAVLDRYFARHVSINSFTETVLRSREPGRDQPMGAAMGRETDAVAFFAALAEAPYRYDFYQTLRRLECLYEGKPRWGQALRPVDEPVRLGQDPDLSFAPSPLASFEAKDGRPPRLQVRLFGLFGPNGPLPLPHHRVRARAAATGRRSDAQPLPRHLPSSLPRALLSSVGAGAAARQPRSPERRIALPCTWARSWAWPRRRFASATTVPDLAKFFHVGALIRQVRNTEGLTRDPQHFPRAGTDRGIRRSLDVARDTASARRLDA